MSADCFMQSGRKEVRGREGSPHVGIEFVTEVYSSVILVSPNYEQGYNKTGINHI